MGASCDCDEKNPKRSIHEISTFLPKWTFWSLFQLIQIFNLLPFYVHSDSRKQSNGAFHELKTRGRDNGGTVIGLDSNSPVTEIQFSMSWEKIGMLLSRGIEFTFKNWNNFFPEVFYRTDFFWQSHHHYNRFSLIGRSEIATKDFTIRLFHIKHRAERWQWDGPNQFFWLVV